MKCRIVSCVVAGLSVTLSSCGTLGIGSDRNVHLAQAEPLFGKSMDKCFDDPAVLLSIIADEDAASAVTRPKECENIVTLIRGVKLGSIVDSEGRARGLDFFENPSPQSQLDYVPLWKRNEIIDSLVAVSNRKCGDYAAHLKTFDGTTNSGLSILSILTGGIGGVVNGEQAARILSGSSAIFSGSRAALNESWFSNQTMHVLVSGFDKVRERQHREITNRQACPIQEYTLMDGIGDALAYHGSCSLLTGLSEAAEAIDRADQPGLDTMRRTLLDLQAIRDQSKGLLAEEYMRSGSALGYLAAQANTAIDNLEATENDLKDAEARFNDAKAKIAAGDTSSELAQKRDAADLQIQSLKRRVYSQKRSVTATKRNYDEEQKRDVAAKTENGARISQPQQTLSQAALCPFKKSAT